MGFGAADDDDDEDDDDGDDVMMTRTRIKMMTCDVDAGQDWRLNPGCTEDP